jgi:hypothetical protein
MNSDRWAAAGAIAGIAGVLVTLVIYIDQRNKPDGDDSGPTPTPMPTSESSEAVQPIEDTSSHGDNETEDTEPATEAEYWEQEWEEVWLYLTPTGTEENCPHTLADFDEEVEDEYYVYTDDMQWGYVPGADLAWNSCGGDQYAYLTIVDSSWDLSTSGRSLNADECWSRAENGDPDDTVYTIDPSTPDLSGFGEGMTICATTSAGDRVVRAIVEYATTGSDGVYLHLSVSMWVR